VTNIESPRTRRPGRRGRGAQARARRRSKHTLRRWSPTILGLLLALILLGTRGAGHTRITLAAADKTSRGQADAAQPRRWTYVNPLGAVRRLEPGRIDMGVDYAGAGPVLALGKGTVTMASNHDSGPLRCWGRTCWPVGGIVVYRLSAGPYAGKYVYVAENITVHVKAGQLLRPGQPIATAHDASPHIETGWASGRGPETLAIADRHQCPWGDPGGWSSVEGQNFDRLLLALGAPSGSLQPNLPKQDMPADWPMWPGSATGMTPRSSLPLAEGSTASSERATGRR
jgi:hypothetical protein